jgi:tRNA A-37 threonylcarbamoyl transferase component Bud32
VTTPSDYVRGTASFTWKTLQAIKFNFNSPFQLNLADGDILIAESVARLIPKRRLVVYGRWQNKPVVAKIFFHAQHARRHMQKDIAGVKMLKENKVPTPTLYYEGVSQDKRIYVLIFERIFDAENLETVWQQRKNENDLLPELKSVIIELATQHVLGVLQHDMHLKNFLLTEKIIYTLDGAQIELFSHLLPKKASINNLALFLSQLGVGVEAYQEKLFRHYAKARGWLLKEDDIGELFLLIKHWDEERWERFEKKIFRESSDFCPLCDISTFGMYNRHEATPELMDFFKNPDMAFSHPSMKMLKEGRSSTVIKVTLGDRDFVIKRYNMKNVAHRLRRAFRPSRAMKSWRLAQKLNLFGVRTAKPVAFLEKRLLGLRGKSYYVTQYVAGEHAGEFFMRQRAHDEKVTKMVKDITHLLRSIANLKITHGDLKVTNILINEHEQPVLIDLDGAAEHVSLSGLRAAWRKEIKRLLENFHDQPSVCEKFKLEFK